MMYRWILVLLLAVALSTRAEPEKPVVVDSVTVYVNEHIITIADVLSLLEPIQRKLRTAYKGDELRARLKSAYEEARTGLIERNLILDSHEKGERQLSEQVIEERINEVVEEMVGDDRAALLEALKADGLTYEEWRGEIRKHVIVSFMRQLVVDQNVKVLPGDIREAYEKKQDRYRTPGGIKLRMIMLPKGPTGENTARQRELIADAKRRIAGGEDFGAVAASISAGQHAKKGGDWGWIDPAILQPTLAESAASLAVGTVSEVVETKGELYVLTVEGRKQSGVQPLDEVRVEIERELRKEAADRLHAQWIADLKQKAYVRVIDINPFE